MIIKKIFLFLLLTFPVLGFSFNDPESLIQWNDLETAISNSDKTPKPLFIEFTAKWCGWCKKMEKTTFKNEEVAELLNEKYYAVKVDFDSPTLIEYQEKKFTGKQLAKHFGIDGLPTMIYIPSNQKGSETIIGYKNAKQLIKELNKLNGK